MLTEKDFSNLTLLSYPRGQMGEYFFLNINKINPSFYLLGSNQYTTTKVDRSLECVTHNHFRENTNAIMLSRKFFGKSVFELIESNDPVAPKALLFFIRILHYLNYRIEEYYKLIKTQQWDVLYSLGTNLNPIDASFTFKAVNRGNLDYTKIFPKLNQIQFYCPQDKMWIPVFLYFIKTISNKEYLLPIWLSNNLNINEYFSYVWDNNKNTPLDNTVNVNTFDILTNKFIPDIFNNHEDINNYCKNNIDLINNYNLSVERSYSKQHIFNIIKPLYEELLNGMGRSSSNHL
jgi:hypothetical protein